MTSANHLPQRLEPWRPHLERAGARLEGQRITAIDGGAGMSAAIRMTPLLDRTWLDFTGAEAVGFLHDQLTIGVSDLDGRSVRLAAYCNAQGRVLALLRVARRDGGLRAELPAELADPIARRLGMFVLRADVRIEEASDVTALGVWGEGAGDLLAGAGMTAPGESFERHRHDTLAVTRLPGPEPRFQVEGPLEAVTARWEEWLEKAAPATSADWRLLDIRAGLPDITGATADRFLPQSLGLERWHALSFRKGCYPGQEVIARLHYRGRLKRHLYRARVPGTRAGPGTEVLDGDGNRTGTIVGAAGEASGRGALVLAVLSERAGSSCHLADSPEARLKELARVGE